MDKIKFTIQMFLFLLFTAFAGSLLGAIWWMGGIFFTFSYKYIQHGFNIKAVTTLFTYYLERPEAAQYIIDCCIGGFVVMQLFTLFAVQIAWMGGNPFYVFTRAFNRGDKIPGLE
jgi:hypothetical protein